VSEEAKCQELGRELLALNSWRRHEFAT